MKHLAHQNTHTFQRERRKHKEIWNQKLSYSHESVWNVTEWEHNILTYARQEEPACLILFFFVHFLLIWFLTVLSHSLFFFPCRNNTHMHMWTLCLIRLMISNRHSSMHRMNGDVRKEKRHKNRRIECEGKWCEECPCVYVLECVIWISFRVRNKAHLLVARRSYKLILIGYKLRAILPEHIILIVTFELSASALENRSR